MKNLMLTCVTAATVLYAASTAAATLIEERDSEMSTIMYIEGGKMRAASPGEEGYMLMDLLGRTIFMVSPATKQAVDMSAMVFGQARGQAPAGNKPVKSGLEKIGPGPEIAGYATDHYVLTANGLECGEYFTSKKAFEDSGWAELWTDVAQSMAEMAASDQDGDDCDIAETDALDPGEVGWPLRTTDADGLVSEVVRIEKNAKAPPGGFDVPSGYSVISMQEMLSGAMPGGAYGSGDDGMDEDIEDFEEQGWEDED